MSRRTSGNDIPRFRRVFTSREKPREEEKEEEEERGDRAREIREMLPFLLTGGESPCAERFYQAHESTALRTSAAI